MSLQCSLREVRGHHLLEPRLHPGLPGKQAYVRLSSSIKTSVTDLADDDAFYVFCASASSHRHHPVSLLLPRPRRQ